MAKGNPFLKGMTQSEITKLRRKAPYVDQVYNPETNEVHYDVVLNRLKDTSKKISDEEANFINQVKRNLQREYWRQGVGIEEAVNGDISDYVSGGTAYTSSTRLNKQKEYFDTLFKPNSVADFVAGFDNFNRNGKIQVGTGAVGKKEPNNRYRINQFMPEDYTRYKGDSGDYYRIPSKYYSTVFESYTTEPYYSKRSDNFEVWLNANPDIKRLKLAQKYTKLRSDKQLYDSVIQNEDKTKSNMTALEKIFNSITSGVENVNRAYAENKARKEQERQDAINRAIKAEAAVASYQRKEKFDREEFNRALAAKDKAYSEETAKRTAEFENWRKTFEATSTEQAKQQAERHTREMSQLRAESVKQAQELANAKVEAERIKSQNAILLKNNTRRRIALKQMGNIGLNFVGAGQRDAQSTALLSVLAGKNRYTPVTRRFNEYGMFTENRGDTAVPDTFLNLISPQSQNRRK